MIPMLLRGAVLAVLVGYASTLSAAELTLDTGTVLTYRGSFTPVKAERDGKQFELRVFVLDRKEQDRKVKGAEVGWLMDERGGGPSFHWTDRFGVAQVDEQWRTTDTAAIQYDYGGGTGIVQVILPFLDPAIALAADASWESGDLKSQVTGQTKLDGRPAWQIQVRNRIGIKRQLVRDAATPVILSMTERVFLGMGQEHDLKLDLAGSEQLPADKVKTLGEQFSMLVAARLKLQRPAKSDNPDLTARDLEALRKLWPTIEKQVAEGPLAELVKGGLRDLNRQAGRAGDVAALANKFKGQLVERFSAESLDGEKFNAESLRGRVTVLHFWTYRDEPLKAPYGQCGYLDFLYDKRKGDKVQVIGVAVDERLAGGDTRSAALRSIRKFRAFMNVSYPIAPDNGALLKQFGDPRSLGAELPLFVVIGPDGKIAHYHVGIYEVEADRGLHQLDAEITKASATSK